MVESLLRILVGNVQQKLSDQLTNVVIIISIFIFLIKQLEEIANELSCSLLHLHHHPWELGFRLLMVACNNPCYPSHGHS